MTLTPEEKQFVAYWKENRTKKKKLIGQLALGLPLSVAIVMAIFVNFFSGWYKRADMVIRSQSSLILVLIVAALLIVIFVTVFSVKHKWDLNEQRFQELQARRNEP